LAGKHEMSLFFLSVLFILDAMKISFLPGMVQKIKFKDF
jgi:hypothetical protein